MKEISDELYEQLDYLGIMPNETRNHNVGKSNYSTKLIQPWTIWRAYPELTSFDHDIIKRVLREKDGETRRMDYEKIIHICEECIRGIDVQEKYKKEEKPNVAKGKQYLCIKDFNIDEGDKMETLFTKGFYYTSYEDGTISANSGLKASISDEVLIEYFKENLTNR